LNIVISTGKCIVALLTEKQITQTMRSVKHWKLNGGTISRTFIAKDFVHAMGFVQSVALLAEKADHHPDIDIRWNNVTLVLSTHSEGGLTKKDFLLAAQINSLTSSKV
jgi:4a-hydroxytetrahydrobiopterin dehydratase